MLWCQILRLLLGQPWECQPAAPVQPFKALYRKHSNKPSVADVGPHLPVFSIFVFSYRNNRYSFLRLAIAF
jgi:hypothetical protein